MSKVLRNSNVYIRMPWFLTKCRTLTDTHLRHTLSTQNGIFLDSSISVIFFRYFSDQSHQESCNPYIYPLPHKLVKLQSMVANCEIVTHPYAEVFCRAAFT